VRLRGVLEDGEPVAAGDRLDGGHVRGVAVEVHGQDESGAGREGGLDLRGVHRVADRVDVHEDGLCSREEDGLAGPDEGVGHGDDLVAGADPVGAERQVQRVGAVGHRAGVSGAAEAGELLLEAAHVLAEDEGGAAEDAGQGLVDLGADARELGLEVHHRDGGRRRGHFVVGS
jgi:hypothetical protein